MSMKSKTGSARVVVLYIKHVKSDLTKDSKLVNVMSPDLLIKRDPGRPKGFKSKMATTEIEIGFRLTRAAAKLASKDKT